MFTQFLLNGLISASAYALVAVGFALIFSSSRFFNLAHGAILAVAAYTAYVLNGRLGLSLPVCAVLAVIIAASLGCLMEVALYRPLRRKQASSLVLLLASLGSYVVIQNLISMNFGDKTKTIDLSTITEGVGILGARITPIQIFTVSISSVLVGLLIVILRRTSAGQVMRAVANDPQLAIISGIDVDNIILCSVAIGSAFAGIAGVLLALDTGMTPTMGLPILMMGIVAVVIGGVNSIPGIVLGSLLLGMAQQFGVWRISAQWQDAIAFVILLVFLLFRPQGFLGRRVKMAEV